MKNLADAVWRREPLPLEGITDMHTHLCGNRPRYPLIGSGTQAMIAEMDRIGVERVFCSHIACALPECVYSNNEVIRAMEEYPGRILGYAVTFPVNDELGIDEVKRCMDKGMRGIKMHFVNGIPYTSEKYDKIWEFAHDNGLVVLLHTWGGVDDSETIFEKSGIDALEPIFEKCGNAKILLGHAGAANPDLYVKYANKYANVYLEPCYSKAPYFMYEYFVNRVDTRKIVYGSDYQVMALSHQIGRVVFADITEEQKKAILVDTPKRILGEE